jgi:hypothetical protein
LLHRRKVGTFDLHLRCQALWLLHKESPVKYHSFSTAMMLIVIGSRAAGAWPDESTKKLPKQYAEVVLNVEGMT